MFLKIHDTLINMSHVAQASIYETAGMAIEDKVYAYKLKLIYSDGSHNEFAFRNQKVVKEDWYPKWVFENLASDDRIVDLTKEFFTHQEFRLWKTNQIRRGKNLEELTALTD